MSKYEHLIKVGSRVALHHRPAVILAKKDDQVKIRMSRRGTVKSFYDTGEVYPSTGRPIVEASVDWDLDGSGTLFMKRMVPLVYLIPADIADKDETGERKKCLEIFCD